MGCPPSVQAGASRWDWCSTTPRRTPVPASPAAASGEFRRTRRLGGNRAGDARFVGTERSAGVTRPDPEAVPPGHDPRAVQRYRAKVLDRIVAACADGSLDPSELTARSEAAQQATTLPGLNAVIADIPGPGWASVAGHRRRARRLIIGLLSPAGWRPFRALAARVRAAAVFGEVMIDLRRTAVTSFVTDITAVALAGEVRIVILTEFRRPDSTRARRCRCARGRAG